MFVPPWRGAKGGERAAVVVRGWQSLRVERGEGVGEEVEAVVRDWQSRFQLSGSLLRVHFNVQHIPLPASSSHTIDRRHSGSRSLFCVLGLFGMY